VTSGAKPPSRAPKPASPRLALPPLDGADDDGQASVDVGGVLPLGAGANGDETVGLDDEVVPLDEATMLAEIDTADDDPGAWLAAGDDAAVDVELDRLPDAGAEYGWTDDTEPSDEWEDDSGLADPPGPPLLGGDRGEEGVEDDEPPRGGADDDDADGFLPPLDRSGGEGGPPRAGRRHLARLLAGQEG
jgi:hypothetical protein